jgi:tetratricopeptide (TPR) repeat protein/tRNA A-37 threonylcarbamoyl transferase component Bud32
MSKKSVFDLDPEQLNQLLSIGKDAVKPVADEQSSSSSVEPQAAPTASLNVFMEKPGGKIGRYKLLSILGEGGMGIVYLAQQERPIKRRVALKVIKPGMDSKRVVARFEAERQALALLDHPNIAHVHDAGTTENGRPYFVMEYVKGLPITEYSDHHKLTIEERLILLRQICLAVHHAHQKGIIHRDIKPSNILVSLERDEAIPKIIDFGIAKAISLPLIERTLATEDSQLLGTPEYMSPEQADMASMDIDTRSDIYSLGVLLYVLLTGVLPFDSTTFREGGIDHVRKVIRETDPKTPSTRLNKLGDEAKKVAENRRTEISTLAKKLHKELEWIPLKAMRKERSERYRSASELADDIENYLDGVPLIAGPPGTGYKMKKFVRRNCVLVGGITAVLFVLVVGVVVSTIFAIGQARARAEAQLIADFLENDVLGSVREAKAGEASISYILDAASKSLEGKFKDRPLIEARICEKLGRMYYILSDPTKAEPHLLNAIRIYQKYNDEQHAIALGGALDTLGWIYMNQDRLYDAERLWTKSLQIRQRVGSVEGQAFAMNALGTTYKDLGKYKDAELLFEKVLQIVQRELGEDNVPFLPYYRCNLAEVYWLQGRYDEAEQLFVEMLENAEWPETYGKWWELQYTYQLGNVYIEQGSYDKAETLFVKTLKTQRLERGDEHRHTLLTMYGLARLYTAQGRYDEAEALFTEMLEIGSRRRGEDHREILRFMNGFAVLLTKQRRYDEAEPLFKKALEGRRQKLDEDHPATLETKNDLAVLYKEQGHYDEAEKLLLEAIEGRCLKLGDKHPHTLKSLNILIALYEVWNKPEKAEEWRAKL